MTINYTQFDLFSGRASRDRGMALATEAEPAAWKVAASEALDQLITCGVPFTSDDLYPLVGSPRHPAAVGALFMHAVRSGRLVEVGRQQSGRALARGRRLTVYRAA